MFRARTDKPTAELDPSCLSPFQRRRLADTWPLVFREHILPLLTEHQFASFFHPTHGAPNRSVQIVLGILLLKDMENFTDEQALDHFAFDLRWHVALGVEGQGVSCCQKTLHNFRHHLRQDDHARRTFENLTSDLQNHILQLDLSKQRLDSTHTNSNVAVLSRLGLFCETIRLFLTRLRVDLPDSFASVAPALRHRYLADDGTPAGFHNTDSQTGKRRLSVVACDLKLLIDRFGGLAQLTDWPQFQNCQRVFSQQCKSPAEPQTAVDPACAQPASATASESASGIPTVVEVELKPAKDISPASLQTPHDPDVSYGIKGQGYEVHLCETFGNKTEQDPDKPELITYVNVAPSCLSDINETIPALEDLKRRQMQPKLLTADTAFNSTEVYLQAQAMGTQLVGPVKGSQELPSSEEVTLGEFHLDFADLEKSRCPSGHPFALIRLKQPSEPTTGDGKPQQQDPDQTKRLSLRMQVEICQSCCKAQTCPMTARQQTKQAQTKEVQTPTESPSGGEAKGSTPVAASSRDVAGSPHPAETRPQTGTSVASNSKAGQEQASQDSDQKEKAEGKDGVSLETNLAVCADPATQEKTPSSEAGQETKEEQPKTQAASQAVEQECQTVGNDKVQETDRQSPGSAQGTKENKPKRGKSQKQPSKRRTEGKQKEAKKETPSKAKTSSGTLLAGVLLVFQMVAGPGSEEQEEENEEPVNEKAGKTRKLTVSEEEWVTSRRRRYQTTGEYKGTYRKRAGIEGTNSELKRKHGLKKLRVRGKARVRQAVYLKAAACNIKRVVNYLAKRAKQKAKT